MQSYLKTGQCTQTDHRFTADDSDTEDTNDDLEDSPQEPNQPPP